MSLHTILRYKAYIIPCYTLEFTYKLLLYKRWIVVIKNSLQHQSIKSFESISSLPQEENSN
jgi:hypothetical protein